MREAVRVLKFVIKDIKDGKCTDEELVDAMGRFYPKSNDEYFRKEDYCNTEEAMKLLGLRSRNQFFDLMKKHGIENHHNEFKDMGFYIKDLERVKTTLTKK
jgi:hypothetical protein